MRALAIRLGIIALIVVGILVLRQFVTGNAGSLTVGDCFELPTTVDETFEDVQHRPCTDPHGGEVILVTNYEPSTDAYPSEADFEDFVADRCLPEFEAYTGRGYELATDLLVDRFVPTEEGWGGGSRKVICFALNADQSNLTQSLKKP